MHNIVEGSCKTIYTNIENAASYTYHIYERHKLTLINCWGKHAETTKFSANIFTCKVSQRLQEVGTYLIPHWNSIHWNEKHLNKFWNSFCMFWSWPDDSTIADILIMKSLYFTWLGIIMTYDVSHYRAFYRTCNAGATMLPNMYRVFVFWHFNCKLSSLLSTFSIVR